MSRKVELILVVCGFECPHHLVNPAYDEHQFSCAKVDKDFDQEDVDAGGGFPGWCPLEVVPE